ERQHDHVARRSEARTLLVEHPSRRDRDPAAVLTPERLDIIRQGLAREPELEEAARDALVLARHRDLDADARLALHGERLAAPAARRSLRACATRVCASTPASGNIMSQRSVQPLVSSAAGTGTFLGQVGGLVPGLLRHTTGTAISSVPAVVITYHVPSADHPM